jgi:hypothetical protein
MTDVYKPTCDIGICGTYVIYNCGLLSRIVLRILLKILRVFRSPVQRPTKEAGEGHLE